MQNLNHAQEITTLAVGLAVFIGILLQVIKLAVGAKLRRNLLPLLSIVLGLVVGLLAYPVSDLDVSLRVIAGFLGGASASGLYDLVAKTTKNK